MDAYVCSKPLQFNNVWLISNERNEKADLLIIPLFNNAINLKNCIDESEDQNWENVIIVENNIDLFFTLFRKKYTNVFVDSDCRLLYGVLNLLCRFGNLYIYEEGFGTYRNDSSVKGNFLKEFVKKTLGIGKSFGESSYCNGSWVYLPALFLQSKSDYTKSVNLINPRFLSGISRNTILRKFFECCDISFLNYSNQKVLIYATSWKLNEKAFVKINQICNDFDFIYIKPHPKILSLDQYDKYSVIESSIMLEFIISDLLKKNNHITVIHENSTSVLYFEKEITSINLDENTVESYEIVKNYIANADL